MEYRATEIQVRSNDDAQMTQVTVEEALRKFPTLLAAAEAGESVLILGENGKTFRLVANCERPAVTGIPKAGRWEGLVAIPDDFDDPLDELQEYME
jgi:antitoxin (DNA-binding transcriptional repressor) of toxin-antitoxin stability system